MLLLYIYQVARQYKMKLTTNVNGFKIITHIQKQRRVSIVYDAKGRPQFTCDDMVCAMHYANTQK